MAHGRPFASAFEAGEDVIYSAPRGFQEPRQTLGDENKKALALNPASYARGAAAAAELSISSHESEGL